MAPQEGPGGKYGAIVLAGCRKFAVAVFSLSIHSYFLWSSAFFAGCGIALTISRPHVNAFMCNKPAQTDKGGPGCEHCRSNILMCQKDICYRAAVNITWQTTASTPERSRYQAFMEAATDRECNNLVDKHASSPVDMIVAINGLQAPKTVTAGCIRFSCGVLKSALGDSSDLSHQSGTCTNALDAKDAGYESVCVCGGLLPAISATQQAAIDTVCGTAVLMSRCPYGGFIGSWCGMTTTTTPSPTTTTVTGVGSGGASSRRLMEVPAGGELAPSPSAARPAPGGFADRDSVVPAAAGDCGGSAGAGRPAATLEISNASLARRLQVTPSPSVELNAQLEDWTVGAWSKCNCYMQCVPGMKTRLVQCLAAQCKTPEPASAERCLCKHCAACSVVFRMFVLGILFFSQGAVAFLIFLSYLHATTVKEEALIKISISQKLLGMICKNMPPIVRMLILTNVSFAMLIVTQTFAPKVFSMSWQKDCFDSADLRITSLIVGGMCLFQLALGQCAKRLARKPPWLFVPDRANWPTPIRQIRYLFRSLGP